MKLRLSEDLALPTEAITEKIAFLGRTGSGKTYAAQKLAEEMHAAGAQVVILDPVGVWFALRLASDGKRPGLPIPVLGGLRGDIPLEPTGGTLIANLVVDRGTSVILDVSQFESDADKARFAQAFADRFFFRKKASPSAVHMFIEECQEFIPQHPQREEARMLHAFTRLVKIGRNFGIGVSLISQRPQEVNKKVLNLTELLFVFQLTGPQERKTIQGWIAEKGIDEDIAGELPKLRVGQPHVWSPAWLKISKVIAIGTKTTFDASSTPVVGKAAAARELSPIDLEQLRTEMAATIEKAKAEDPRALRAEIARLRGELATKHKAVHIPPPVSTKRVEVSVLKETHVKTLDRAISRFEGLAGKLVALAEKVIAAEKSARESAAQVYTVARARFQAPPEPPQRARFQAPPEPPQRPVVPLSRPASPIVARHARSGRQSGKEPRDRILHSLAWWQAAHVERPTREQVAFVAGYTVNGHFNNTLGTLRAEELVDYPAGNLVELSAAGARVAGPIDAVPTRTDLIDRVRAVLRGEPARRIFEVIVEAPGPLSREEAASGAGYTVNGHFNNEIGRLHAIGVVNYPTRGAVALSRIFEDLS